MTEERVDIIGLEISSISFDQALCKVKELAYRQVPSYVCFANSHMVVEAYKDKSFAQQVNNASLVLADGMPIAFACSVLHNKKQDRIAGMDFMPRLLSSLNQRQNLPPRIFFYGSTPEVLTGITKFVQEKYQNILVTGAISPPFRSLNSDEIEQDVLSINNASPHFVFVGLGCPKQEKWMAENFKKINAVLLGVGGAFLTTAGLQKRAPYWMQKLSLEWMFRLMQEPRRLFKRYLVTNSQFSYLLIRSLLKKLFYGKE